MWNKEILTILESSDDLASIIGDRIYPEIPENNATRPFIVYSKQGSEPAESVLPGRGILTVYTIGIDIWCDTVAMMDDITNIINDLLDHYRGGLIQGSFFTGDANSPVIINGGDIIQHGEMFFTVKIGRHFSSAFSCAFS